MGAEQTFGEVASLGVFQAEHSLVTEDRELKSDAILHSACECIPSFRMTNVIQGYFCLRTVLK